MFRMELRPLLVAIAFAMLALSAASPAYTLSGMPLSSVKNLPHSNSYPVEAHLQLIKALQQQESKFHSGWWANGITRIHFAGNTEALNEQLQAAAQCPGTTIGVLLNEIDKNWDWQLVHDYDAGSVKLQFVVNLKSKQLDLKKLIIPPAKGPELPR